MSFLSLSELASIDSQEQEGPTERFKVGLTDWTGLQELSRAVGGRSSQQAAPAILPFLAAWPGQPRHRACANTENVSAQTQHLLIRAGLRSSAGEENKNTCPVILARPPDCPRN